MGNSDFEFIRGDVTNEVYVECDEIYNLACPASPVHYQADSVKTIKTGMFGALHLLDLAESCNARNLQASRRSAGASAAGKLSGQRQSERYPHLLR